MEEAKKEDLRISDYFNLGKEQFELDFVDIGVYKDTRLFLDPWAIRQGGDDFSIRCHNIIVDFFSSVLEKVRNNERDIALYMLGSLTEPSETHLGFSRGGVFGSGVGKDKAGLIYNALSESAAVQSGFLNDLEDTALLIEGIQEDNISDIVTNLIRFELIKYTQRQCNIYNIPMRILPTGYYWDISNHDWKTSREEMLVIEGKKILLLPKLFVRKKLSINFDEYYGFDILEFEQMQHLNAGSSLCRTLKSGKIKEPTKKTLRESHPENKKQYIYQVTKDNPQILENYKKRKSQKIQKLLNFTDDEDNGKIIEKLIHDLDNLAAGKENAYKYEKLIISILEILFHPHLHNPKIQYSIIDGLKIIDICYDNTAIGGFFGDIMKSKIACRKIYFECKNYTNDIKNPEIDQLNGRFSEKNTEIGFIVCRKVNDKDSYNARVGYLANKQSKFILLLEDKDLITLLKMKKEGKERDINDYLNDKLNLLLGE